MAGLCVAAWPQPFGHRRQQAAAHGDGRVPQRAISMRRVMLSQIEGMLAKLITRRLSEFVRDKRGVSAVEFAMLLPLMLTLYLGGVEVSQGISIDRKVTLTARTVADLVAQVATIDTAGVNAALGAATAIMAPYPDGNAKVTVS